MNKLALYIACNMVWFISKCLACLSLCSVKIYNKPITHNDVMLLEIDVMVFQDILKGFVLLQHQVFYYNLQVSNRCSILDPEDSPAVVVLGTSLTGISNTKHFMHENTQCCYKYKILWCRQNFYYEQSVLS